MTDIQTWGQWTITHNSERDRFEARKTIDGREILRYSESLRNLKDALNRYDNDEQIQAEKFKPIPAYVWEHGMNKFTYGKISSIFLDQWSSVKARFKGANADTWKAMSIYSDTFALQTPENEKKIEEVNSISEQIRELESQRYEIRKTMTYFIPPKL